MAIKHSKSCDIAIFIPCPVFIAVGKPFVEFLEYNLVAVLCPWGAVIPAVHLDDRILYILSGDGIEFNYIDSLSYKWYNNLTLKAH